MFSKKLTRQIKKCFGSEFESNLEAFLDKISKTSDFENSGLCENMKSLMLNLPDFFSQVDETYTQMDEKVQLSSRSLEVSSQELTEANFRLLRMNSDVEAMLNCLGQGFLMIDREGQCLPGYSKICETLFEAKPDGKTLPELLKIPLEKQRTVLQWIHLLYSDVTDFDELAAIGPATFPHSRGLVIELEFKPVRNSAGEIQSIVLVATDKTETIAARQQASKMMAHAQLVSAILKDKNQFLYFLRFAKTTIATILEEGKKECLREENIRFLKFQLHTLKGSAASFGFFDLQEKIHTAEDSLQQYLKTGDMNDTFKNQIEAIDSSFQTTIGENRELFDSVLAYSGPIREIDLKSLISFKNSLTENDKGTLLEDFEKGFIQLPAEKVFKRFESILKETAERFKIAKPQLAIHSDGTRLTPEAMEGLLNALIHAFRNIVCHGIESDDERRSLGKSVPANVSVQVSSEKSSGSKKLKIQIRDDGRGIHPQNIKRKLIEMGREVLANSLSDQELINYVFQPDFSTASKVSEYAGRGVGMSALREEVLQLGGQISLQTMPGQGLILSIELPEDYSTQLGRVSVPA